MQTHRFTTKLHPIIPPSLPQRPTMEAFITGPIPPFRTRRLFPAQLCPRRQLLRSPPRVRFSATTDEAPPLNGPPAPIQPPRRPDPINAPDTPVAYAPSRPNRPARPQPSKNGTDGYRPPRDRYSQSTRQEGLERQDRFRPYGRGERGPTQDDFVPDPNATYYTTCGACKASFEINPDDIGQRGRKVACSVCGNEWFQRLDKLSVLDTENEEMKPYPVEKKDALMEEQSRLRSERRNRRRDGERRERTDRRDFREGGRGRSDRPGQSTHTIFIGNLPFTLQKEELEKVVRGAVDFIRLSLVTDANMKSKGFAFADLRSAEDLQKAIAQLDGVYVGGRPMAVRESRKN